MASRLKVSASVVKAALSLALWIVVMPAAGCSHRPPTPIASGSNPLLGTKPAWSPRVLHVPDNLLGIVSPSFVTRPDLEISQADFAQILSAVAPHLTSREKVVDCYFDPATPDHAQLKVHMTPTAHGDGVAEIEKKQGLWVFIGCWYPN
jgi:hypothetical protein